MGRMSPSSSRAERFSLGAILVVAALLRFHHLEALPPAHYRDVALTAIDALRAASGHPCLHYTYDEGLYANLMGLLFLLFGASDWMVRAPGALFGVLTCLGLYRLGRAFGLPRAGLYGAALLAVSFWHLVLSRSGFRAILLPLLLVEAFALLREALRGGRGARAGVAGMLFGLGIHVYPAARVAPLILPFYLLAEFGFDRRAWLAARRPVVGFLLGAFIVAAPMLLHYVHHPEHVTLPRRNLTIWSPLFDKSRLWPELGHNLVATALMFHLRGDENWRHNLPGSPMLDPLTGALLLLGGAVALRSLWRTADRPGGAADRPGSATDSETPRPLAWLLAAWVPVMLLPNILSVEGVPHALRSSGVLPALMLLAGLGLERVERILGRGLPRRLTAALISSALVLLGAVTAHRYFDTWGGDARMVAAHDGAYRAAARLLMTAPPGEAFLLTNGLGLRSHGQPAEVQVYLFEMRDRPPTLIGPRDADLLVLGGRRALVAFVRRDEGAVAAIRRLNPGASLAEITASDLSSESPVYQVN